MDSTALGRASASLCEIDNWPILRRVRLGGIDSVLPGKLMRTKMNQNRRASDRFVTLRAVVLVRTDRMRTRPLSD